MYYDIAVYNALYRRWVPEGKLLTEAAARRRLAYRKRRNPTARYMITMARRRGAKS